MVQYGVWLCCLQRSWSEHWEFPQVPLGWESLTLWVAGRLPHANGLYFWVLSITFDFVHEFDLAARPSVSEISTHFWQQNTVQMILEEIMWSWQLSVNRVPVVNLSSSPPVLVEASLLTWLSQSPDFFLDIICPWFSTETCDVGATGWNKFPCFSVYSKKLCARSSFCAKLQQAFEHGNR